MNQEDFESEFREAYHVYEEVRCDCGERVDLSEADDINEAVELWNDHVRTVHRNAGSGEGPEP